MLKTIQILEHFEFQIKDAQSVYHISSDLRINMSEIGVHLRLVISLKSCQLGIVVIVSNSVNLVVYLVTYLDY